jgi:hypothetical protein
VSSLPVPTGGGFYCADVVGDNEYPDTAVWNHSCNPSNAQIWLVGTKGWIQLNSNQTLCLEPRGSYTAAGFPVMIEDCDGSTAQQWRFGPDGSLRDGAGGLCLTVPTDQAAEANFNRINLTVTTCQDQLAQSWTLQPTPPPTTTS